MFSLSDKKFVVFFFSNFLYLSFWHGEISIAFVILVPYFSFHVTLVALI